MLKHVQRKRVFAFFVQNVAVILTSYLQKSNNFDLSLISVCQITIDMDTIETLRIILLSQQKYELSNSACMKKLPSLLIGF